MIDILMAVRNGSFFIEQQIDSILNQDTQDFYLYIRDNCSSDHTCKIIQKYVDRYPQKISLIHSDKDVGPAGNFSRLIDHAKSDYVMFSDHDDVWLPNKITLSIKKMHELEERYGIEKPLLVHSDLRVVNRNLKVVGESMWGFAKMKPLDEEGSLKEQLLQNTVTGNTMLINRSLLKLSSPIPSEAVMHDWWLGLVAATFGVVGAIKDQTILYRQHGNNDTGVKPYAFSLSRLQVSDRRERQRVQAHAFLNRYRHLLDEKDQEVINLYLRFVTCNRLERGYLMYKHNFYKYGLMRNLKELLI